MRQWALTLLLFALPLFGQNTRFDFQATTTSGVGNLVPVLAIPGAQISFYINCTTLPCSTPATTYQSISSGTTCPSNAQVVWQLPVAQACTATADSQGNFGGYFQSGNYQFTETVSQKTFGPYEFSVGGGGSGGITNTCQLNNEFWVAGCAVGSASLCPNGGTTQAECAANAANAWSNTNLANTVIHLAPGINVSSSTAFNFTGTYAPSIVGDATFGSAIRQTGTITAAPVSYGCNVFASSITLKDFTIDADFNAPAALYIGKAQEYNVEGVTLIGANGTGTTSNFAQIGDSTCGGGGGATFEGLYNHLTVSGRGTGPSSWAAATCTQSGGTPSCTVSNGGTYHWNTSQAYLVGYQSGTSSKPCTTMGTITPAFTVNGTWTWGGTFYSQTLNTYTLASVSFSGFSGCTGNLYLYAPDVPSPAYGIYLPFATDSVFNMPVVAGAGQTAGVANFNTANVFNGIHVYNNYVGYKAAGGGGHLYGMDCDSDLIMIQVTGASPVEESGCNAFYPSASLAKFKGAVMTDLSGDTGHQSTFSQNNVVGGPGAAPTDWHPWLQSSGPTDLNGGWPGSLTDTSSPTVNPAGNFRHDPSANATNDVVAPEVPATSAANVISPSRLLGWNAYSGTASQTDYWTFQATGSASGVPTQEIFNVFAPSNALAPVSGRFWLFQTPAIAPVNGSANANSITVGFRGNYGNGSAAVNLGWNWSAQIGSGTTPSNTFNITPTSCPGTCQISTNANFVTTGSTSVSSPLLNLTNSGFSGAFTPSAFSGAHVFTMPDATGAVPVAPAAVTAGKATCWKATGQIGFCSTQPDSTGSCTCN